MGNDLPLDGYRSYLELLARARLHPRVQPRLGVSDLVQQTLLEAHQGRAAFRGDTSGELAAWLRKILARNLADALRAMKRLKRDPAREVRDALDRSSARMERWLAAEQTSPSLAVARAEQHRDLADAVAALPDAQRDAVVMRYWQGLKVNEIAAVMERSPEAIAGLLQRGARTLRARMGPR